MKSVLSLMILCLVLSGCGKPVPISQKLKQDHPISTFEISAADLNIFLAQQGIQPPSQMVSDTVYVLPTEDWVRTHFAFALRDFLHEIQTDIYMAEENDCDDYSFSGMLVAKAIHHNTIRKQKHTGIAVGVFWYKKDSGGYHAINFSVVRDTTLISQTNPNGLKLIFMEPQTTEGDIILKLSKQEISECTAFII